MPPAGMHRSIGLTMRDVWEIPLPWPKPPLSLNDRMHWAKRHRITSELRLIGKAKARPIPPLGRCRVTLVWYVNDRRRRDEDNPMPTLKALADGVADAGVVTDDTHDRMQKRVKIIYKPKTERPAGMVLRVEKMGEEAWRSHE